MSDRQLVDLLLANDEEAVEYVFFHRCDRMFAHIAKGLFHSNVKKEELITEFYLYLRADDWRRLRQFEFKSELATWLTVVAIRFFNEKKPFQPTELEESDTELIDELTSVTNEPDILNEISKLELYKAVEKLPKARERQALIGFLVGKQVETIADEMGCSESAVYKMIKRAKNAVSKIMKGVEL